MSRSTIQMVLCLLAPSAFARSVLKKSTSTTSCRALTALQCCVPPAARRFLKSTSSVLPACTQPATWLIIGEPSRLVQQLSAEFTKGRGVCISLAHGTVFKETTPLQFTTNFDHADIDRVLDTLTDRNLPPLHGIIYLSALGGAVLPLSDAATASELCQLYARDGIPVLHTLQVLSSREWSSPPRLWVITRSAQIVNDGDPAAIKIRTALGPWTSCCP